MALWLQLPQLPRRRRHTFGCPAWNVSLGESGDCRPFLSQCDLHFELQASSFPSDRAKIAYVISYLSGCAKAWATAEWDRRSAVCNSLPLFIKTFTLVFQTVTPGREAARALVGLRQGRRSVFDYAIEFRTLAADSGWNQPALVDAFYNGLSEMLKDQLTLLDLLSELDSLIYLASRIDKRLTEWQRNHYRPNFSYLSPAQQMRTQSPVHQSFSVAAFASPSCVSAEPMQIGRMQLSPEE